MPIRLSSRFLVAGAATLVLCGAAGVVLGGFAAGGGVDARHARSSFDIGPESQAADNARPGASGGAYAAGDPADDVMDRPVICQGCGPTLAERRTMGNDVQGFTDGVMAPDASAHDEQRAIDDDVARHMGDDGPAAAAPPVLSHSRVSTLEGANGEGASSPTSSPATHRPAASPTAARVGF
ncbi:hypothetical protein [Sphingobium aquiterrae]|uniref:hypothetical protein n=1 Tax=Sphingobium aquiterrae TaxID=2038656 RepID=UPI003016ED11